jgi:hypothetical protein
MEINHSIIKDTLGKPSHAYDDARAKLVRPVGLSNQIVQDHNVNLLIKKFKT